MPNRTQKPVLTTGEVARICNVAPRTVAKWIDQGQLRGYRIPGSRDRRVPREALIRFMRDYGIPLDRLSSGPVRVVLLTPRSAQADRLAEALARQSDWEVDRTDDPFEVGLLLGARRPDVLVVDLATEVVWQRMRDIIQTRLPDLSVRCVVIDTRPDPVRSTSTANALEGADAYLCGAFDPEALIAACR